MPGQWVGSDRSKRLPSNWPDIRDQILKRDPICKVCHSRRSVQVDHKKNGDDHSSFNLQGICEPCHKKKTAQEGALARYRFKRMRDQEQHPGVGA